MTATAGPNLVLFSSLRGRLVEELRAVLAAARGKDDALAASVARRDVPGLVAAVLAVVEQHAPDENGHCSTCSTRWRRRHTPCRMLLAVTLARADADNAVSAGA